MSALLIWIIPVTVFVLTSFFLIKKSIKKNTAKSSVKQGASFSLSATISKAKGMVMSQTVTFKVVAVVILVLLALRYLKSYYDTETYGGVVELKLGTIRLDTGIMYHFYRDQNSWHAITTPEKNSTVVLKYRNGCFADCGTRFVPGDFEVDQHFAKDGSIGECLRIKGETDPPGNYYIVTTKPITVIVTGKLSHPRSK